MATKQAKKSSKTTKNEKLTYVAIVLDRSGSMGAIKKETVQAINEQFVLLRNKGKLGGKTYVTLIQFDDVIETCFVNKSTDELTEFSEKDFVPRNYTAMYDGIGKVISELKSMPCTDDTGYLVCVISDGAENASTEYNQQSLKNIIEELQATGKWTFTYMLANQDITTVSANTGVPVSNSYSYMANTAGVRAASYAMTGSLSTYMTARSVGSTQSSTFYSAS